MNGSEGRGCMLTPCLKSWIYAVSQRMRDDIMIFLGEKLFPAPLPRFPTTTASLSPHPSTWFQRSNKKSQTPEQPPSSDLFSRPPAAPSVFTSLHLPARKDAGR